MCKEKLSLEENWSTIIKQATYSDKCSYNESMQRRWRKDYAVRWRKYMYLFWTWFKTMDPFCTIPLSYTEVTFSYNQFVRNQFSFRLHKSDAHCVFICELSLRMSHGWQRARVCKVEKNEYRFPFYLYLVIKGIKKRNHRVKTVSSVNGCTLFFLHLFFLNKLCSGRNWKRKESQLINLFIFIYTTCASKSHYSYILVHSKLFISKWVKVIRKLHLINGI